MAHDLATPPVEPEAPPPDHRSTVRALTFNMVAIVVGKVVAVVIGLLSIALITRALGPDGYGAYRTILTFVSFVSIGSDLGLQLVVLRELGRPGRDHGRLMGAAMLLRVLISAAVMTTGALISLLMPYDAEIVQGVLVAAPYYVVFQSAMMLQSVFQRHLRQGLQAIAETVGGLVMLALVWVALQAEAGVVPMVGAMLVGGIVQLIVAWPMARRLQPFRLHADMEIWREMVRTGLPIAGSRVILSAILRGDILLLSLLATDMAVGLYGVPSKMFEILVTLAVLFNGMLMPMLVGSLAKKDLSSANLTAGHALTAMLVFGGGVIAVFAAFPAEVLTLVAGSEFSAAAPALTLVGVAIASNAVAQVYRHILTAMDRQKQAFTMDCIGLAVALVAYFTLIPLYSYLGAAIGTAVTETVLCIGLMVAVLRAGLRPPVVAAFVKTVLVSAASTAAMLGLAQTGLAWPIAMVVGGLVFFGLVAATGLAPPAYLSAILKRKKRKPA
ncbi:flippase [Geminicoccus roseus]|uniref:flippase n=1 Tax=Geminicoccus roseus TaxID=404900 RepID=UPI00040F5AA3|nr:flippase [Geminicoccus roseus]